MNRFSKFRNWGDAHHPKMLDIIRMLVGLINSPESSEL